MFKSGPSLPFVYQKDNRNCFWLSTRCSSILYLLACFVVLLFILLQFTFIEQDVEILSFIFELHTARAKAKAKASRH